MLEVGARGQTDKMEKDQETNSERLWGGQTESNVKRESRYCLACHCLFSPSGWDQWARNAARTGMGVCKAWRDRRVGDGAEMRVKDRWKGSYLWVSGLVEIQPRHTTLAMTYEHIQSQLRDLGQGSRLFTKHAHTFDVWLHFNCIKVLATS